MFELKTISLFGSLEPARLVMLAAQGSFGTCDRPEELQRRITRKRGFYFLGLGSFEVRDARDHILFYVERGDLFGELEIFGNPMKEWKIHLNEPVTYFFIPEEKTQDLLKNYETLKSEALDVYKRRLVDIKRGGPAQPKVVEDRVILYVYGPKGGCGTTTVAANLAATLASSIGKKVCCLDVAFELGTLRDFFTREEKKKTLDQLFSELMLTHDVLAREYLFHHERSGVDCLFGPCRVEPLPTFDLSRFWEMIGILKKNYDYLVFDTPSFMGPMEQEIIRCCTDILLVMELDYSSIFNTVRAFNFLSKNNFFEKRLKILCNRSDRKFQLDEERVPKNLREYVSFFLPSAGENCIPAVNENVPVTIRFPQSKIAEAFGVVARDYAGLEVQEKKDLFSRILDTIF